MEYSFESICNKCWEIYRKERLESKLLKSQSAFFYQYFLHLFTLFLKLNAYLRCRTARRIEDCLSRQTDLVIGTEQSNYTELHVPQATQESVCANSAVWPVSHFNCRLIANSNRLK